MTSKLSETTFKLAPQRNRCCRFSIFFQATISVQNKITERSGSLTTLIFVTAEYGYPNPKLMWFQGGGSWNPFVKHYMRKGCTTYRIDTPLLPSLRLTHVFLMSTKLSKLSPILICPFRSTPTYCTSSKYHPLFSCMSSFIPPLLKLSMLRLWFSGLVSYAFELRIPPSLFFYSLFSFYVV